MKLALLAVVVGIELLIMAYGLGMLSLIAWALISGVIHAV